MPARRSRGSRATGSAEEACGRNLSRRWNEIASALRGCSPEGTAVFAAGDRVVVTNGVFAGLAGILIAPADRDEPTYRVRIKLWDEEVTVELPAGWLRGSGVNPPGPAPR